MLCVLAVANLVLAGVNAFVRRPWWAIVSAFSAGWCFRALEELYR